MCDCSNLASEVLKTSREADLCTHAAISRVMLRRSSSSASRSRSTYSAMLALIAMALPLQLEREPLQSSPGKTQASRVAALRLRTTYQDVAAFSGSRPLDYLRHHLISMTQTADSYPRPPVMRLLLCILGGCQHNNERNERIVRPLSHLRPRDLCSGTLRSLHFAL